jgi:hypothetical protein
MRRRCDNCGAHLQVWGAHRFCSMLCERIYIWSGGSRPDTNTGSGTHGR